MLDGFEKPHDRLYRTVSFLIGESYSRSTYTNECPAMLPPQPEILADPQNLGQ